MYRMVASFVTHHAPLICHPSAGAAIITLSLIDHRHSTGENMIPNRLLYAVLFLSIAPLSATAFDIGSDLFVTGDLHESWKAEPLSDPPKMFDELPPTSKKGDCRLSRSGKKKGGVTAFQYDSAEDAATAYDIILKGMGGDTQVVDGLGDQSRSYSAVTKFPPAAKMPDFHRAGVVFLRGKTVVHIGLSDMKAEELVPLAKKIDARVQK
jgi:hypothetical protein